MTASYICVAYGYSLRGHEVFWVDCDRLVRLIHMGEADPRIPHVIVAALGRFKGKDGDRMHLFPPETRSGVRIRVWLERLAALLQAEGKSLCPAFCDDERYQLSSSDIKCVFHPILEELKVMKVPCCQELSLQVSRLEIITGVVFLFVVEQKGKCWIMEWILWLLILFIVGHILRKVLTESNQALI